MIEITAEVRALIDKAAAGVELAGDEYIDPSDGLIHCKKCGGQRQTVVPCFGKSGYFMPRCICQCQREAEEQRKAAEERQRRMERIKRRKAQGLQDRYLYDYTFSNDNGKNPLMDKARAYVENWKEAYRNNTGLLLFGDVGTGKSFFAGCIANALLDQDVPVLMTNFPTILNRLTGMFSEDRSEFIASFDEYDLLIIDDLGVERSTEYANGVFIPCGGGLLRAGRPCFFVPRHPCNLEHIPVSCSHNTKRMEEKEMRFLLKLLFAPVMAVLAVVSWFLVFVVGLSSGILCIPAAILGFFGLFILFVDSVSYGVGLLVIAFLISPYGLPMLAGWLVAKLHVLRYMLRDWIYG